MAGISDDEMLLSPGKQLVLCPHQRRGKSGDLNSLHSDLSSPPQWHTSPRSVSNEREGVAWMWDPPSHIDQQRSLQCKALIPDISFSPFLRPRWSFNFEHAVRHALPPINRNYHPCLQEIPNTVDSHQFFAARVLPPIESCEPLGPPVLFLEGLFGFFEPDRCPSIIPVPQRRGAEKKNPKKLSEVADQQHHCISPSLLQTDPCTTSLERAGPCSHTRLHMVCLVYISIPFHQTVLPSYVPQKSGPLLSGLGLQFFTLPIILWWVVLGSSSRPSH